MAADLLRDVATVISAVRAGSRDVVSAAREAIARLEVAALLADDHGRLIAGNDAASWLTGYAEVDFVRLSVPEITGPADEERFTPLWRAFIGVGEQRGTYQLLTRSGRAVLVEYVAASIAPGIHLSLLRPLTNGPAPPDPGPA